MEALRTFNRGMVMDCNCGVCGNCGECEDGEDYLDSLAGFLFSLEEHEAFAERMEQEALEAELNDSDALEG